MSETEAKRRGIYGDDMTRPIADLLCEIRSSMVKARGRLSDIYFEKPFMKERVAAAEGLLTCGIVYLYNEIESVKKWEAPPPIDPHKG